MNKKLIIGTTFLSIFILIGIGYQPMLAEESVIIDKKEKECKISIKDHEELNDFHIILVEFKSQLFDDCKCNDGNKSFRYYICLSIVLIGLSFVGVINVLNLITLGQLPGLLDFLVEIFSNVIVQPLLLLFDCYSYWDI
jgi:hypothetical protein